VLCWNDVHTTFGENLSTGTKFRNEGNGAHRENLSTGTNFETWAMGHIMKLFQTGTNFETRAMGHIVKIFKTGSNFEMRARGHIGHGDRVSLHTVLKKGKQIERQILIHVIIPAKSSFDVHQQPTK
jgi:hypothetical protein